MSALDCKIHENMVIKKIPSIIAHGRSVNAILRGKTTKRARENFSLLLSNLRKV